jgi:branched-chain amino acid transport system substrate-binding protein
MAIEDSGLLAKGWKIDLISGDHQNKPDLGANIAKQWIDVEKVDVFEETVRVEISAGLLQAHRDDPRG